MGYKFTEGPRTTSRSVAQIAAAVQEIGDNLAFLGPLRRSGVKTQARFGSGNYGFFSPSADDDPFSSAGPAPAWRVGWQWGATIQPSQSWAPALNQGYAVIFEVFDDGSIRRVVAKVVGQSQRREPKRFVEMVFERL